MGAHWKIQFLGDVFHEKPIYRGELSKKRGLGQFAALRGGRAGKKEGGRCFWEGFDAPMHTMYSFSTLKVTLKFPPKITIQ